jgi:hypothetical protein
VVVTSLTIEEGLKSQGIGYQYAIFQTKLISFFLLVVSFESFSLMLLQKLPQSDCTWRLNRPRDFPGEKIPLSRVSN